MQNWKLLIGLLVIVFAHFIQAQQNENSQQQSNDLQKQKEKEEEQKLKETNKRRIELLKQMEERKFEHEKQIDEINKRQSTLKEEDELQDELDALEFEKFKQDRQTTEDKKQDYDEKILKMQQEIPKDWKPKSNDQELISNKEEQIKLIEDKFNIVLWGEEHPFKSYWISQVNNTITYKFQFKLAGFSQEGQIMSTEMARAAEENQIKIIQLAEQGIDLDHEKVFTGLIEFEQKLKEYNVFVAKQYKPFIACKPKEVKNKEDQKIDL